MKQLIKLFINYNYKNVLIVIVGIILCTTTIGGFVVNHNKEVKQLKQTIKQQEQTITNLSKQKVADVQCTVELNIKNNKNGVVVLDANQTASKLGEQVKAALNNK